MSKQFGNRHIPTEETDKIKSGSSIKGRKRFGVKETHTFNGFGGKGIVLTWITWYHKEKQRDDKIASLLKKTFRSEKVTYEKINK